MEPEDERNFLERIRVIEPYQIGRSAYESERERFIPIEGVASLEGNLSIYTLAFVRPRDVSLIISRADSGTTHNLDTANSPVVEFGRCRRKGERLSVGRLWYQETRLVGRNRLENKDKDFSRWAQKIFDWIKKNYSYMPEQLCYGGPVALARSIAGSLRLGPPTDSGLSLEERKRILGLTD